MSTTYCQDVDVRRILQNTFAFGTTTAPTKVDVEACINAAEDEIDKRTQHAWREITVTDEFYDLLVTNIDNQGSGLPIGLRHRKIKAFDTAKDKLEVWTGTSYEDWLDTKTEGRNKDFWLDAERGILWLRYYFAFYRKMAVRLTYRYGEASVPYDIKDACAMMAAIIFIQNDDRAALLNETGDSTRLSYEGRIKYLTEKIDRILHNRTEIPVI